MFKLKKFAEDCTHCNLCVEQCAFLQRYGNPAKVVSAFDLDNGNFPNLPFECSLCELCTSVCPAGLNPAKLFLEMRRDIVYRSGWDFSKHKALLDFERRGMSRRYTYYALPAQCDTVFFPGCTLAGSRPKQTLRLFHYLRSHVPAIGIVMDCCSKPSHDLGRHEWFKKNFGEMKRLLKEKGIKKILAACPGCHKIFKDYGGSIQVKTVYEILWQKGLPSLEKMSGSVSIHDPCAARHDERVHTAIRLLVRSLGLDVTELEHSGKNTLCCGEGGAVGFLDPLLSKNWGRLIARESSGKKLVTYCAGCYEILNKATSVCHILDLVFEPQAALSGRVNAYRAPITYLNRVLLKHRFKKNMVASVICEREATNHY